MTEEKVTCRTPSSHKDETTNIPAWKFERVRSEILAILSNKNMKFSQLTSAVRHRLSKDEIAQIGSMGWHVTTVKLEMEVRDEIKRLARVSPQTLMLSPSMQGRAHQVQTTERRNSSIQPKASSRLLRMLGLKS